MPTSPLTAIVLAAGLGKRMKSALPKVLHRVAGRPLVHYPVVAALEVGAERVVVVASPETREALEDSLADAFGSVRLRFAIQSPPRGTGDAVRVAMPEVETERVLILCGDTPLLRVSDLSALLGAVTGEVSLSLLTCLLENPAGYGRVLRDSQGKVTEVREDRDLRTPEERAIREVNAGMYVANTAFLRKALSELRPANAQGEYYFTDVVAAAAAQGGAVGVVGDRQGLLGVNDRVQLAEADSLMFQRIAERHGRHGVTVRGNARIEDTVKIGDDVVIESGVVLRGHTTVGDLCHIDVGAVLTDVNLPAESWIPPYSVLNG